MIAAKAVDGQGWKIMKKAIGAALAVGLLAVSAAPTGAQAGSLRETLDEFGFMGSWAQDCQRPPDRENVWREVAAAGEDVVFTESLGERFVPSSYRVLKVRRPAKDTVVLTITLNNTSRQDLTMVLRGDRIRTMVNQPHGSATPVVKDGVVVGNGMSTPWLMRCEKGRLRARL